MGTCSVCDNRAYVFCSHDKAPMCNYCHAVYHQIILKDRRFLGSVIPLVRECSRYRSRNRGKNAFIQVKRRSQKT